MNNLQADKATLRKQIRAAFPGEAARQQESAALVQHLLRWDVLQKAHTVCAFVPMKREADIRPLLEALTHMPGKTLVLPRVQGEGQMTLHAVASLEELIPGAYNIPEPAASAPVVEPSQLDLLLVPVEGLDPSGTRLGKGGGFYDRLLPHITCPAAAVLLQYQWVPRIPKAAWDIPLRLAADAEGIHVLPSL